MPGFATLSGMRTSLDSARRSSVAFARVCLSIEHFTGCSCDFARLPQTCPSLSHNLELIYIYIYMHVLGFISGPQGFLWSPCSNWGCVKEPARHAGAPALCTARINAGRQKQQLVPGLRDVKVLEVSPQFKLQFCILFIYIYI